MNEFEVKTESEILLKKLLTEIRYLQDKISDIAKKVDRLWGVLKFEETDYDPSRVAMKETKNVLPVDEEKRSLKILKCTKPIDPDKYYFRVMYREWFYGPFDTEDAVIEAVKWLDNYEPFWNYDGVTYIRGMNPLPDDFVFGFPEIGGDFRKRLEMVGLLRR